MAPAPAVTTSPPHFARVPEGGAEVAPSTSAPVNLLELGWKNGVFQDYVRTGRLLGAGSFGQVHLGAHAESKKPVAVKVLPKHRPKLSRGKVVEKLAREVHILQRLQPCPRVVALEGCYEDHDSVAVVTEACMGGDLQKYSDTHGPLTERSLALVALEVLSMISSCHQLGVLHGDVKPANFCIKDEHRHPYCTSDAALLRSPWLLAIDFGCSQLHHGFPRLSKRSGTPVYMAPEIFNRSYSFEADVWSTGVLLYQMFTRRFPFWEGDAYSRALSLDEVARAISGADIKYDFGPWLTMSPEGLQFVQACLTREAKARISVDEALQHPWLRRVLAAPQSAGGEAAAANNIVRSMMLQQQQHHHHQQGSRRDAPVAA